MVALERAVRPLRRRSCLVLPQSARSVTEKEEDEEEKEKKEEDDDDEKVGNLRATKCCLPGETKVRISL